MGEAKRRQAAGLPPRGRSDPIGAGPAGASPDGLPPAVLRERIAGAVHRVIDTCLDAPAWQLCSVYAFLGMAVASAATGRRDYFVNAGSLFWVPDPDDPTYWIAMDASAGGLARGELHAWLVRPLGGGQAELVDLTTRHLPAYTTGLGSLAGAVQAGLVAPPAGFVAAEEKPRGGVRWARPACPDYVWTAVREGTRWQPHDWLHYLPDREATEALWRLGLPLPEADFRRLVEHALLLVRHPDVTLIGPRRREAVAG